MTRFLSAIAAICLVSLPAIAENASTGDVYACAEITGNDERLACYDAAVGRLKAAEDAGEVTTVTRAQVEQAKRETFGFSMPSLRSFGFKNDDGSQEKFDEVTLPVKSVSRDAAGKLRITLQGGQVWVQNDGMRIRPKNPSEARIYAAALGSYKMKIDGGMAFRVRREQ